MKEKLEQIREQAQQVIDTVKDLKGLEEIRVAYLWKEGRADRRIARHEGAERGGAAGHRSRWPMKCALRSSRHGWRSAVRCWARLLMEAELEREKLDVTMPGKHPRLGHKHPLYKTLEEVQNIFIGMGYNVVDGPEVESQYYDFEALNIPEGHPARDEQDTFYIKGRQRAAAENADVSGADPYHGADEASDQGNRAWTCIPQ